MNSQGKLETDALLAQSLKELVVSKPIEKITIKDITDKAGVIRPTFYNHFQDKFELLEWIITKELLEPLHPLIQAGMITEAMTLLLTNIEKDKVFYNRFTKMEGVVSFHDVAMKCVKQTLFDIFETFSTGKEKKYVWLNPEMLAIYYAQSMCFVAEEWISSGMIISPKEMAEAYRVMMTSSLEDILKEL